MKTGLFIGRFQPFHNGHIKAMKHIEKECDKIIIVIGSAQYGFTSRNPITGGERIEMIGSVLNSELSKPFCVIPVEDIGCYPKYVSHVESLVPKFDIVYTGNSIIKSLFAEKGYKIKNLRKILFHATDIRQRIIKKKLWKNFVPREIYNFILKNNIDERIRRCNNEKT